MIHSRKSKRPDIKKIINLNEPLANDELWYLDKRVDLDIIVNTESGSIIQPPLNAEDVGRIIKEKRREKANAKKSGKFQLTLNKNKLGKKQ
ncbi:MAG: hypothetical protein LBH95_02925 [Oscillospiraceae bacterium]|nr:hypothetical protein [Oscillospiraceae bacterium]